jgi:hypothetical protein
MKNFFLVLIFFVITLIPSGLPTELQKEIVHYISPKKETAQIRLEKYAKSGPEQLVFPSTSPFVFVKNTSRGDDYTQLSLRKLRKDRVVLPNLQFWVSYNEFRIDNDLKDIAIDLVNYSNVQTRQYVFFDGSVNNDLDSVVMRYWPIKRYI